MNILVIDLGSKLTKCVMFHTSVDISKKDGLNMLKEYSIVYVKIFESNSTKLLLLELNRVYDYLGKSVDLTIFIPNKNSYDMTYRLEENDIDKDKMFKSIRSSLSVNNAGKKDNYITNIELQNFSLANNHTDVLITRLSLMDYDKLVYLIKNLKLTDVMVFNGISPLRCLAPNKGDYIVYDMGNSSQIMAYVKDGVIKSVQRKDISLKSLDDELLKSYKPEELYKIKHSSSIMDISAMNPAVKIIITNIGSVVEDFRRLNGITPDIKLINIGGYSNIRLESDFFNYEQIPIVNDIRFKNKNKISPVLMSYLYNCLACFLYYFENDNTIDFLNNKKDLAIVSTKLDSFFNRTKILRKLVVGLLLLNLGTSLSLNYALKEYDQFASVNTSALTSETDKYNELQKKIDYQINTNDLLKNSFKLNTLISKLSNVKPNTVNLESFQYSNGSLILNTITSDLEQNSYFVKELQNIFGNVEVHSPEIVKKGTKPLFKIKVLCSEYKK